MSTLLALAACDDDAGGSSGVPDDVGGLPVDGSAVCERFTLAQVATATMMTLDEPIAGGNDTPPRCTYQTTDPGGAGHHDPDRARRGLAGDKAFSIDFQGGVAFDR